MIEFNNIIVEQIELQLNLGFGDKFYLPYNYVIYFEREQNLDLSLYVRSNCETIKTKFASVGLNFIYFPLIPTTSKKIEELVSYYFPQLNYYQIPDKVGVEFNEKMLSQILTNSQEEIDFILDKNNFIPSQVKAEDIVNLIGYQGSIKSGLIFLKNYSEVIGVSDSFYSNPDYNYQLFFEETLLYLTP